MTDLELLYTLIGLYVFCMIIIMVNIKYIMFSLKLQFNSMRYKKQIGLIFFRNLGNGFGFPAIVPLHKQIHVTKKNKPDAETRFYTREMFNEGLFFGFPYAFFDREDMKCSLGLYKQNCDTEGNALYHTVYSGTKNDKQEPIYIQTQIPMLQSVKTSVQISPQTLNTVISVAALGKALQDFLKKNQILLYICGFALLAAGVSAYFGYTNQDAISNLCATKFSELSKQVLTVVGNSTTIIK